MESLSHFSLSDIYFLASGEFCHLSADNLCKQFLPRTSVLISVETVGHSDSVSSGKKFLKKLILKEVNRRHKKHEKLPSIQRVKHSQR